MSSLSFQFCAYLFLSECLMCISNFTINFWWWNHWVRRYVQTLCIDIDMDLDLDLNLNLDGYRYGYGYEYGDGDRETDRDTGIGI